MLRFTWTHQGRLADEGSLLRCMWDDYCPWSVLMAVPRGLVAWGETPDNMIPFLVC